MGKLKHKLTKQNLLNGFCFIIGFSIFCVISELDYQDAIKAEEHKTEYQENMIARQKLQAEYLKWEKENETDRGIEWIGLLGR